MHKITQNKNTENPFGIPFKGVFALCCFAMLVVYFGYFRAVLTSAYGLSNMKEGELQINNKCFI
jgi:hypothetical protein